MADIRRITRDEFREDIIGPVVENATEFVDWLDDHGFRFDPETPRIVYGHEPYYTPRTYYGVDAGVSLLDVFTPLLDAQVAAGRITLWTRRPVLGLLQDDDDRRRDRRRRAAPRRRRRGRTRDAVVLATGGFAADAELFAELEGFPLVSGAHPTSTGDGLILAREAAPALQGQGVYLPTFGGLPHPTTPGRVQWEERPLLTQERAPWEIYVDRAGNRWVAEDEPSIDAKERALVAERRRPHVLDDLRRPRRRRVGADGRQLDAGRRARTANVREGVTQRRHPRRARRGHRHRRGRPARHRRALQRRWSPTASDPDFGRTFLPAPIEKPPFYAMRNHGVTLITFVGVDVDAELRVRREDGSVDRRACTRSARSSAPPRRPASRSAPG